MAVAEATFAPDVALPSHRRLRILRQLVRKKIAVLAVCYLLVFYSAGLLAPVIAPQDPNEQHVTIADRAQTPSGDHWFGTDYLGRDLFSRVLYAARTTVLFTFVVLLTGGLVLGLGLGLVAGYRGGWADTTIMRVGEILSGLPTLVLMLAISAAFRPRITDLSHWLQDHTMFGADAPTLVKFFIVSAVTVPFAWVGSARIVRSQVLAIREDAYVQAAEAMGASAWRVITRHIFPGVVPLWVVGLSGSMAGIAGAEVALSYLGFGIDPPGSSFGTMIYSVQGSRNLQDHPHLLLASSLPVILFFFAWNLLGDALVDLLETRSNQPR